MTIKTFEYCSLEYLNQWFDYDMIYCDVFLNGNQNAKLEMLKSAGGFYKVARNLPTEFDTKVGIKRYLPVLEIIEKVKKSQFDSNTVGEIISIERKISSAYGNRNLLSLTTKFLWLRIKQPIIIYDSQARIALGVDEGNLDGYYKKWKETYRKHHFAISNACSLLPKLHLYASNQRIGTKKYIQKIVSQTWFQTWFHERVYDNYLWHKGNKP